MLWQWSQILDHDSSHTQAGEGEIPAYLSPRGGFTFDRDGDRFWFENDPYFLSRYEQLEELRATALADVIRRNTQTEDEISDDVFSMAASEN